MSPSNSIAPPVGATGTDLPDAEFLAALEDAALPAGEFRHADHVRLTWLHLAGQSVPDAIARLRTILRRFAIRHTGDDTRYHETMTVAYARLIAAARDGAKRPETFAGFAARNPDLFARGRLERHYSAALLATAVARKSWVEPDREPLPEPAAAPGAPSPGDR